MKKAWKCREKVVCEEFKEHYLNKPYGDVCSKNAHLAFTQHPYRWMTIGAELRHIEEAGLQDVKNFFFKHYTPANAILTVAGHVTLPQVKQLAEKWFGPIPAGIRYERKNKSRTASNGAPAFES